MSSELTIHPAGDAAVMVDLGDAIDLDLNRRVHALAEAIRRYFDGNTVHVVSAYASLMVSYDPAALTFESVAAAVRRAGADSRSPADPVRRFVVPVVYGGEFGPDLEIVARCHSLQTADVVSLHAGRDYPIFCVGFAPGFPFLGGLDPSLHTPRLDTPRPRVPAGSVAIGGRQTGIYPAPMPGGWRLIGRTPFRVFDVERDPPAAYRAGDMIRFHPITPLEYARIEPLGVMPEGQIRESGSP